MSGADRGPTLGSDGDTAPPWRYDGDSVLVLRCGPTLRRLEGSSPDMGEVWGHSGDPAASSCPAVPGVRDDVGEGASLQELHHHPELVPNQVAVVHLHHVLMLVVPHDHHLHAGGGVGTARGGPAVPAARARPLSLGGALPNCRSISTCHSCSSGSSPGTVLPRLKPRDPEGSEGPDICILFRGAPTPCTPHAADVDL